MQCPRCQHTRTTSAICPKCGFTGDPAQLAELGHLDWLLTDWLFGETENRPAPSPELRQHYHERQEKLQTALGLRWAPFDSGEAAATWPEALRLEALFDQINAWLAAGVLKTGFLSQDYARLLELRSRLAAHPRPNYPASDPERLELVEFLIEKTKALDLLGEFKTPQAQKQVSSALLQKKQILEIRLRPKPQPAPEPVTQPQPRPAPPPAPAAVPPAPPTPKIPFREQLWRSILSERTLNSLLFLGIFLLFAAAISFVIWGWKDFPALVRVAIPSSFTLLFFFLGWLVRNKTALYRSGIALSAIAALFIPIDSYTVYANYGSPPQGWPEFWLATSLACLIAYSLATLSIQSRFFGYLTGVAAGSTVLAGLELLHVSRDWFSAGLSVLAVVLLFLAHGFSRLKNPGRWRAFAEPFRYLALLLPAVLMPLMLGLRLVTRNTYDALHYALTVDWFLGGLIFGWGALRYRSRALGMLAALALPVAVYLGQGALFFNTGITPAWHAFGLAALTPLYVFTSYKLLQRTEDEILLAHGRTARNWGTVLVIIAALLPFTDLTSGAAAAASHTLLTFSTALAAGLWKRPRYVYAASLFAFIAATFGMTELHLPLEQLSLGWASLALLHLFLALALSRPRAAFSLAPLVVAGYVIAALAVFPPLFIYNGDLLVYALGNWLALAAWGASHAWKRQPGFVPGPPLPEKASWLVKSLDSGALYHWLTSLPLPFWLWAVFTNGHPVDLTLPLALAALAWGMVFMSHHLRFAGQAVQRPWRWTGLLVSVAAVFVALAIDLPGQTPMLVLFSAGLLYFADALTARQSVEFYPAALATAWGLLGLLERAGVATDFLILTLSGLIALYLLSGLLAERFRRAGYKFLAPLYHSAHLLGLILVIWIYIQPLNDLAGGSTWTDRSQLIGGLAQLLLAVCYGLFAWGRYQERWGYAAAWLGAGGGGLVVLLYSTGQGSLAAKGALIVVAFVLAERALYRLKSYTVLKSRLRAGLRLAWRLFSRPLLVTGWIGSVGIIGLALVRNLLWLGGGRIQQIWAAAGLLIITALYALSARMFRRARFVWFAMLLLFAPWTILTNLGWFTAWKPTPPEFGISWAALAWFLFLLGLLVARFAPSSYALPLKVGPQVLLPFSMLWAVADTRSSLYTVGLAIALYGISAWLKLRQKPASTFSATKFIYPALGLLPLWSVYWLDWLFPAARHEHFGLVLLPFGIFGLLGGLALEKLAPTPELRRAYGLPAYLTGYATIIVGTLLTAHLPVLLAIALLYAALLLAASAWIFHNALWVYPAAALTLLAWLTALSAAEVPVERRGWWLLGLAAVYLAQAWLLRRVKLNAYGAALLAAGFAVIALSLPPSSQDKPGAFWGYGGAALLYAVCAFWLRQPLLLMLACGLAVVPYASGLQLSPIQPDYYGLLLFPGALVALFLGWWADRRLGALNDFPWSQPFDWPLAFAKRLFHWWGLPLYTLGLGLASFAPIFTHARAELTALNFAILILFYAAAVFRFNNRFWLLLAILAGHLSLGFYLSYLNWWRLDPAGGWLRFLPMTALMLALGLGLERWLNEGTPLHSQRMVKGWSRPFYLFLVLDIVLAQTATFNSPEAGRLVSLFHAVLIGVLAAAWGSALLPYFSTLLGAVALFQWRAAVDLPARGFAIWLAALGLGYGALGFGYALIVRRPRLQSGARVEKAWERILSLWAQPFQRSGMLLSLIALGLVPVLGVNLATWAVRALFGLSFRELIDLETAWMAVWVLALVGLLYVTAAAHYRRLRLGYLAVALLLFSWFTYAFYISAWDGLRLAQWYALPAGLYLLAIGLLEWRQGNRALARWLDYAAILLMLGSLFWQTLTFGWWFALLLGGEGLAAFWWGSARRLRRFFYTGMVGVILAVLGQLVNALQYVNQWITFGLIGLGLVVMAIIVERKLDAIKAWQAVLETWE